MFSPFLFSIFILSYQSVTDMHFNDVHIRLLQTDKNIQIPMKDNTNNFECIHGFINLKRVQTNTTNSSTVQRSRPTFTEFQINRNVIPNQ